MMKFELKLCILQTFVSSTKKILLAPLDWGLGHATRCIPLITFWLGKGYNVHVAANNTIRKLLQPEFPELVFLELPGYNIHYSVKKRLLPFTIITQVPKILQAIRNEHKWLIALINETKYDTIVSDNRYGFYHHSVHSVIITHQLQILVPQSQLLQKLLNAFNHSFLNKFNECWIPDYIHEKMSGDLCRQTLKIPIKHLGNLSRFKGIPKQEKKYDILVLLSGPEPQRSILETEISNQLKLVSYKCLVVLGKPNLETDIRSFALNITFANHVMSHELEDLIQSSSIIICRSGYSTIMDLIKLNRHAILIPTPGQTEQEYLADYFFMKQWGLSYKQDDLRIELMLDDYQKFKFEAYPMWNLTQYETVLHEIG